MAKQRKKKNRVGALGVVLSLVLTLTLSALAAAGLYFWGDSRPEPVSLREGGAAEPTLVSLYVPPAAVENPAPTAAEASAPEVEAYDPYDLDEIIVQEDGLTVARVTGKLFTGFLTIVDDPLRVTLGRCPAFGDNFHGRTVAEMANEYGAVLAVNGGGFLDPGGAGNGGVPTGNVVYNGQLFYGYWSPTVGMDAAGKLHVGEFSGDVCLQRGLQWAVSYGPTLIVDGQIRAPLDTTIEEPRTAIGQREDGAIIILTLAGRQASALGVTCYDLARIMAGFGAVNASNLDGGASSDLYYNGSYLNVRNSSGSPRPIPTAVLVMPAA